MKWLPGVKVIYSFNMFIFTVGAALSIVLLNEYMLAICLCAVIVCVIGLHEESK